MREQNLAHGDRISIGESVLVFLVEADPVDLMRSTVEVTDTAELDAEADLLHQEDALYLQIGRAHV